MLWNELYSPAVRKELDGLLKKAAARCAKDPDALKRIGFMRREFYDRLQEGAKRYAESTAEVAEWKVHILLNTNKQYNKTFSYRSIYCVVISL